MVELPSVEGESGRAALGRTLRFLREKAGQTLGQLAEETAYDKSYLSRLESGERLSKVAVMEDLGRYYGAGDLLVSLWKAARNDVFKDKYKEYMGLEETARVIRLFSLGVPGLLQTEEFAHYLLSGAQTTADSDEEIDEQVAARVGRQQLLERSPAPEVRIVIDEFAFRRPAALAQTWDDQLLRIEAVAMWRHVALQVLPFAAGAHHHMSGTLALLWQKDGTAVAYKEGNGCSELIEDQEEVLKARLSYDRLRDLALSPPESLAFIRGALEEHRS